VTNVPTAETNRNCQPICFLSCCAGRPTYGISPKGGAACTSPVKPMTISARPLANSAQNFPQATGVHWIERWLIRPLLCRL
jgi:hypothetical protein